MIPLYLIMRCLQINLNMYALRGGHAYFAFTEHLEKHAYVILEPFLMFTQGI